jgi:mono/diheme cytochrome c family protein
MTAHLRTAIFVGLIAAAVAQTAKSEDLSGYSGARLYKRFCAACHGDTGHGDGVVAPFFKLSPPDLTLITKRHAGVFPADKIAMVIDGREVHPPHGSREMPVWGLDFQMSNPDNPNRKKQAEKMISKLVEYLHSIQQK